MTWRRGLEALSERPFRLLFGAYAVSLLGDAINRLALAFAVLEISDSASDVGLVLAAQSLPLVAFLLAGGVFADRLSRRALMVAADATRLAAQGTMAALLLAGVAEVWQLAALAAVHGVASAFFNPASEGLLPRVVSAENLHGANALRGIAHAAGSIAGPAVAGVLVATAGAGWALAIDAVTFALSGLLLLRLPLPAHVRPAPTSFLADLRSGWRAFTARRWVWSIVAGSALNNALLGVLWVLGPVVASRSLGGAPAWGLASAALGAGSLLGGMVVLRVRPRRPLLAGGLVVGLAALPMAAVAAVAPVAVLAGAMFAAGAGLMVFNALWETALQQHVPDESLSRVIAYDWFGSLALDPLGRAMAGPIAAAVGIATTLWAAAAVYLLVTVLQLAVADVRRLESRGRPAAA